MITLWGTFKLRQAQMSLPGGKEILESEDQWTFGQIIPILLLIVPITSTMATIFDQIIQSGPDGHSDGFPTEWCIASSHDPSRISNATEAHRNLRPGAVDNGPMAINSTSSLLEDASPPRRMLELEEYLEDCHIKDYSGVPWLGACIICEYLCIHVSLSRLPGWELSSRPVCAWALKASSCRLP